MQITSSSGVYKRLIYTIMVVIYSYLERRHDKVFKFHMNNSSFF